MSETQSLSEPSFTVGDVAEAGELSAATIRQWYQREIVTIGRQDREPEYLGLGRKLSGATALMLAIMGRFIRIGVAPRAAMEAAREFAHTGDEDRDPGHLFPTGSTFILIGPEASHIVNVQSGDTLEDVFARYGESDSPLAVLRLDSLIDGVRERLATLASRN